MKIYGIGLEFEIFDAIWAKGFYLHFDDRSNHEIKFGI
jgi:hypothetical protein